MLNWFNRGLVGRGLVVLGVLVILSGCTKPERKSRSDPSVPRVAGGGISRQAGPVSVPTSTVKARLLIAPILEGDGVENTALSLESHEQFTQSLVAELNRNPAVVVVESQRFSSMINQSVGRVDTPFLVSEGRRMGVQAVVLSQLLEASINAKESGFGVLQERAAVVQVRVRVRVVEVNSGRELLSDTRRFQQPVRSFVVGSLGQSAAEEKNKTMLERGLVQLGRRMAEDIAQTAGKLNWRGRIAKVSGPKFFINAGKRTGLMVGDILKVTRAGEDIFDPDTGILIGQAEGRSKGTLEVVGFVGEDGAEALVHSGGGFVENDTVSLF